MSPRPILKSLPPTIAAATRPLPFYRTGHVHFPPTPDISATYLTHSGRSYDRSAIVVSPNECALPERNCPQRTYVLCEGKAEGRLLKAAALGGVQSDEEEDERTPAADSAAAQRTDYFSIPSLTPPSLTPDMTSESDDSDGLTSPPPADEGGAHPGHPPISILDVSLSDKMGTGASNAEHVQAALAFLPHPLPPARERKRSLSPHDRERKKEKAHSFSGNDRGFVPSRRRTLSFTPNIPPDLGCLGGF